MNYIISEEQFLVQIGKVHTKADRNSMLKSFRSIDQSKITQEIQKQYTDLVEKLKGVPVVIVANAFACVSKLYNLFKIDRNMKRYEILFDHAIQANFDEFKKALESIKIRKCLKQSQLQDQEMIDKFMTHVKWLYGQIDINNISNSLEDLCCTFTQCEHEGDVITSVFRRTKQGTYKLLCYHSKMKGFWSSDHEEIKDESWSDIDFSIFEF